MNNKKFLNIFMAFLLIFPSLIAGEIPVAALVPATHQAGKVQRPAPPVPGSPYTGEPITLDLVNVDLVDFFRIISELSGLNLIIDPDVKGTITIHVDNVPWDQVFETVLKSHGLEKKIEGNVVHMDGNGSLHIRVNDQVQ